MDKTDEKILKLLKQGLVSGEKIALSLGISRTAIWKRIKKLEKKGYKIKHLKEGYLLYESSPYLLPYEIKKYLKTSWLGKNYIFFEEIHSTNTYAKEKNFPHGTVILAENQTAGKGRKGRKWISQKGKGLYFSIVLREGINLNNFLIFSLLFPLAVRDAIKKYVSSEIFLKWPNDLYINEKKFAGFLIESEIEGNEVIKLIVGIGININNTEESFKNLDRPATSLFLEEKRTLDRKKIFSDILLSIEKYLENINFSKIIESTERYLLWKGKDVIIPDINISGKLLGINEKGGLRILTSNGIKNIYSGDVSLRAPET